MHIQHLRIARATENLDLVVPFYAQLLDFEVIGRFADHDGFDGVMLGRPGADFHLEFTRQRGVAFQAYPTSGDDLLVFYFDDDAWREMQQRIVALELRAEPLANPYWDRGGVTIRDPAGQPIVLYGGTWTNRPHRT